MEIQLIAELIHSDMLDFPEKVVILNLATAQNYFVVVVCTARFSHMESNQTQISGSIDYKKRQ